MNRIHLDNRSVALAKSVLISLSAAGGASRDTVQGTIGLGAGWLIEQGLAPFVWHVWQTALSQTAPPDFVNSLRLSYYAALGDAELHQSELLVVLHQLAEQGLKPVIFKGAALAHTVYPDRVCRPMGDLDLWLTPEELPIAQAALARLGYLQSFKSDRPLAMHRLYGGEIAMNGANSFSGLVELHWGIFPGEWLRRTAGVDEVGIRSRLRQIKILEQPVKILMPEDAIIQIAVHSAINHQLGMAGLRSLIDITLLARSEPIDWAIVVERARAWRVATATWLVVKLTVSLTGLDEASSVVKSLSPSKLRSWLIDRFVNPRSVVELQDLRSSAIRFVYMLLLVDRSTDMLKLIGRTLWPEREWLTARYGQAGTKTVLLHMFNVIRGKI